jgi:hypothetical protein
MCEQSKKASWKVCGMANQQTPLSQVLGRNNFFFRKNGMFDCK